MKTILYTGCLLFAATTSFAQTVELTGAIQSKKGDVLTIVMKNSPAKKGDKLKLLKYTVGKIGKMSFTSWLDIADVEVVSNVDGKVVVTILKENSVTLINGKKKDHFTKDSEVKFGQ